MNGRPSVQGCDFRSDGTPSSRRRSARRMQPLLSEERSEQERTSERRLTPPPWPRLSVTFTSIFFLPRKSAPQNAPPSLCSYAPRAVGVCARVSSSLWPLIVAPQSVGVLGVNGAKACYRHLSSRTCQNSQQKLSGAPVVSVRFRSRRATLTPAGDGRNGCWQMAGLVLPRKVF